MLSHPIPFEFVRREVRPSRDLVMKLFEGGEELVDFMSSLAAFRLLQLHDCTQPPERVVSAVRKFGADIAPILVARLKERITLPDTVPLGDCCVCLQRHDESTRILPCGHEFHTRCVCEWYVESKSLGCPLCRHNLK